MPLYDFICDNCLHRREVQKPISDRDSEELCISCLRPMRRQFHATPIKFIGRDFYSTDRTTHKKARFRVE